MLATYAWPYRYSMAAGFLALAATNYLSVEIPVRIGDAVDAYSNARNAFPPILQVVWMGFAVIVVRTLSRVLVFNPGRAAEYELRRDLFAHLLALQPSFYASRSTGDIINRASSDITYARVVMGFGLMQVINVTLALGLTAWKLFSLSPILTLWAVLPIAVGMIVVRSGIGRIFRLHRLAQEQLGTLSDHILGSFQGIATIQGFNAEPRFRKRFEHHSNNLLQTNITMARLGSVSFPGLTLAGSISVFSLLFVGGPMAIEGALSVGDLVAFQGLLLMLLPPLRSLGWMISVFQRGQVSLERIFDLIDSPVERPEGDHPAPLPAAGQGPGFVIRDLTFAYPDAPERPVLSGLNETIPAGAVVGLFGATGSGKSTFIRLLTRHYDPPGGTVFVASEEGVETDITRVDQKEWRRRLAVAPQRPFLFSDTIGENVEMSARPADLAKEGHAPIDQSRRDEAVSLAALEPDLLALPDGVDTVVGERGIMLSGGQRQRVALARALYRREADIIVLDDVLSAVDHDTERKLVASLSRVRSNTGRPTTFIASHRLSALRHADLVLVFEDGRVVDRGTHDSLVQRPGTYRDTYLAQRPEGAMEAAE